MIRTQIFLTQTEVRILQSTSKETKTSKSEIIRKAVDQYFGISQASRREILSAFDEARGTLKGSGLKKANPKDAKFLVIVLDTSLLVEILEDGPKASWIRRQLEGLPENESLAISAVTYFEILNGRNPQSVEKSPFLKLMNVLALDKDVARCAAEVYARSFGKSRRNIPDALIAATAIVHHASLWTLDADFKKISGLSLL